MLDASIPTDIAAVAININPNIDVSTGMMLVFAKNDTTTKMVDPNVLLIMPVADNKFVKLVYEGDSQIKEVTDSTNKNDMTYEFKYLTKLGVATIVGRYFATWNIVA